MVWGCSLSLVGCLDSKCEAPGWGEAALCSLWLRWDLCLSLFLNSLHGAAKRQFGNMFILMWAGIAGQLGNESYVQVTWKYQNPLQFWTAGQGLRWTAVEQTSRRVCIFMHKCVWESLCQVCLGVAAEAALVPSREVLYDFVVGDVGL